MDAPAGLTRRHALGGLAAAGLSLPLLAACADDGAQSSGPTADVSEVPPRSADATDTGSTASGDLVAVADVPVGSGVIVATAGVVVTQPTAGEFKAFSAICTHSGCPVTSIDTAVIRCECHGSTFSITDGSVLGGPAPTALPEKQVSISGDRITAS